VTAFAATLELEIAHQLITDGVDYLASKLGAIPTKS
jgi:hypothetical protein